jgi:site-specific recombinase XerD
VTEYLAHLSKRGLSGASRARKLAVIREYFRSCQVWGLIDKSPVDGIDAPRMEKRAPSAALSRRWQSPRLLHPDDVPPDWDAGE